MMESWIEERPHLRGLADKVRELFAMADEAYQRGRVGGAAMDYAAFEARVSQATAELECAVHQTVLGSLDIDAPFVRVWGKSYRRVHRTERAYGTMAGAVPVTRTLSRELGKRSGPVLDPIAMRAGMVDASWLPVQPTPAPAEPVRLTRPRAGWTGLGERDRAALEEQQRRTEEAKPPKIERNWRMAYCATVRAAGRRCTGTLEPL